MDEIKAEDEKDVTTFRFPGRWRRFSKGQRLSLISTALLLFIIPVTLFAVLAPKPLVPSRAQTPATSPLPGTLPGDINADNAVNIQDYILLSNAFGNANYDARADLDSSGTINIQDYQILSNNFGRTG